MSTSKTFAWFATTGIGCRAMNNIGKWVLQQFRNLTLIPQFFRALAKEWNNILFGETVVGVGFLLWWALKNPNNPRLVVVFVAAMFVAGYHAWRAAYGRLEKKLAITRILPPQEWTVAHDSPGAGSLARGWYFEV